MNDEVGRDDTKNPSGAFTGSEGWILGSAELQSALTSRAIDAHGTPAWP